MPLFKEIPPEYLCSITLDPCSGESITAEDLQANSALKMKIEQFLKDKDICSDKIFGDLINAAITTESQQFTSVTANGLLNSLEQNFNYLTWHLNVRDEDGSTPLHCND